MYDKVFKNAFGIRVKRKYLSKVVRKEAHLRGYFELPHLSQLPKRMTVIRPTYIDCIEQSNDRADDPYAKRISVKYISKKVGYGVFAKEAIRSGVVGIYAGQLKKVNHYSKSRYLFSFTTKILNNIMIDGEKKGNWAAFINHNPSDSKSTNLIVREYFYKGLPYIVFWAPKKIKKGAQLLYDYGDSYWDSLEVNPKKF